MHSSSSKFSAECEMKEFWKSINVWQSYRNLVASFFMDQRVLSQNCRTGCISVPFIFVQVRYFVHAHYVVDPNPCGRQPVIKATGTCSWYTIHVTVLVTQASSTCCHCRRVKTQPHMQWRIQLCLVACLLFHSGRVFSKLAINAIAQFTMKHFQFLSAVV